MEKPPLILIALYYLNLKEGERPLCYPTLTLSILKQAPKYVYLAGFFGASYVFCNAYLAPLIGTGAVVTLSLVGQIISSLVIDQFGLLGAIKKPIKFIQVIGIIFLFIGVLGIELY